jgi:uncharacterized protein YcbK (DUF882 family)
MRRLEKTLTGITVERGETMPKSKTYTLLLKGYDGKVTPRLAKGTEQLRRNFQVYEFRANRQDGLDLACVSEYDLDTLQYIRSMLGARVEVTSAGRTPAYNARPDVGGSERSMHRLMFDCVDFIIHGITDAQYEAARQYLIERGYQGLFTYPGHRFHTDIGNRDKFTTHDYR